MEYENTYTKTIDFIGLASIGAICFLYSLFWSSFAETHIAVPFLDFPIFIGEILLFVCVILLFLKWKAAHFKFGGKYWIFLLYSGWVLFRAFHGYFQWGPLALRNAALFYYPFFAFAGYHFYRKDFFNQKTIYALFFLLVITKIVVGINFMYYFLTPYLMLSIFLILKMQIQKIRYLTFILLICSFPPPVFFQGSRSFLVSNLVVTAFLFLIYFWVFVKGGKIIKFLGLMVVFFVSILIFLKFAPSEKVQSLTTPQYIVEQFRAYDEMIQTNKRNYVWREIPVKIYNPNKNQIKWDNIKEQEEIGHKIRGNVNNIMKEIINQVEKKGADTDNPEGIRPVDISRISPANVTENKMDEGKIVQEKREEPDVEFAREESKYFRVFQEQRERVRKEVFGLNETDQRKMMYFDEEFGTAVNEAVENLVEKKEVIDGTKLGRGMQTEYGNILFRILIWREMVEEIVKERKWFGFSFGKPQRSLSLENSGFAAGEWGRDGWIAPHNAFLNMIYRAGLLGVGMVCIIFILLLRMTREFLGKQRLEGMFLVSILIYWVALSSSLVVLELPYQAIPFWALFGITFAHLYKTTGEFRL